MALSGLITDDFVLVDSKDVEIHGKPAFTSFLEDFRSLDLGLRIEHGELGVSGDQILMSGDQTAHDERMCGRVQWQITFRGGLICRIQTFRGESPVSIVRIVEKMRDGSGSVDAAMDLNRQSA